MYSPSVNIPSGSSHDVLHGTFYLGENALNVNVKQVEVSIAVTIVRKALGASIWTELVVPIGISLMNLNLWAVHHIHLGLRLTLH